MAAGEFNFDQIESRIQELDDYLTTRKLALKGADKVEDLDQFIDKANELSSTLGKLKNKFRVAVQSEIDSKQNSLIVQELQHANDKRAVVLFKKVRDAGSQWREDNDVHDAVPNDDQSTSNDFEKPVSFDN